MHSAAPIVVALRRLPLPCPLNALYMSIPIRVRAGSGSRIVQKLVATTRARKCKLAVIAAIRAQLGGDGPRIDRPCTLSYTVTIPDRRKRDLDCYEKQLLDCLQAAGVVADDARIVQISKEMMPEPKRPGWIDLEVSALPEGA